MSTSHAIDSKSAAAQLINPLMAPEPSEMDGPGSHFGNTMAAHQPNAPTVVPGSSSSSGDRYSTPTKSSPSARTRAVSNASSSSKRAEIFGGDYGDAASRRRAGSQGTPRQATPPTYTEAVASGSGSGSGDRSHHRRSSSLKERYPGDRSHEPLNMLRKDSKKAHRSPHLNKRTMPGPDTIDRLDPAIGGIPYHHEGPFDAALLSRNSNKKYAPVAALETSNAEALKATPPENVKNAVNRHMPLEGVADVPPGVEDRFGRRYNYEEDGNQQWEGSLTDTGIQGGDENMETLDRALKAHRIDENGIELEDRAGIDRAYRDAERRGTLDNRDPRLIAGDEGKYAQMLQANAHDNDAGSSGGLRASLKKRIGSLKHRNED